MRWFNEHEPSRSRARRHIALIASVLSIAALVVSVRWEVGWCNAASRFACLGDGCLQMGFNLERVQDLGLQPGLYARRTWRTDWAMAWRPFHAKQGWNTRGALRWDFLVIPIWPAALASIVACAYYHGCVRALRAGRGRVCVSCGYDLTDLPAKAGSIRCPECAGPNPPPR
jgi:hypothetical protein